MKKAVFGGGRIFLKALGILTLPLCWCVKKTPAFSALGQEGKKGGALDFNVKEDPILNQKFFEESRSSAPKVRLLSLGKILKATKRPAMVVVWSVNCPPCIGELPSLDKAQKIYGGKVNIIPVCIDGLKGRRIYQEKNIKNLSFFGLKDVGDVQNFFPDTVAQKGIPFMIIYNGKGKRVFHHVGALSFGDMSKVLKKVVSSEQNMKK